MIARNGQLLSERDRRFLWVVLRFAAAASIAVTSLWAQQGESDVGEASVSTGLAFGATGTKVLVSGAVGISLDRYVVLMVGGTYIPMGDDTFVPVSGLVAHASGLYDFTIDLQFRIPLRSKWEPYGIIAPALLYNHYQRLRIHPNGTAYYFGVGDVRGGAEVGGGVRYYLREYWGLKGEFRATISSRNFGSLSVGVFRQF
jgi:hypothetical protein